ncbi:MAG: hypothetical protein BSOLF_0272 [Candidatus Carbobacillus altaicus]|uniref:Uncharacterized protein n=1 Tax=Candidatus Carbonibacillus altaicus TaxID=2163959 RepID=A0A2R6Y131_9BACL|nr:MAG: hypothetical protein BSOLF_0272 [Candidatus Carbobacillus altaicus]
MFIVSRRRASHQTEIIIASLPEMVDTKDGRSPIHIPF